MIELSCENNDNGARPNLNPGGIAPGDASHPRTISRLGESFPDRMQGHRSPHGESQTESNRGAKLRGKARFGNYADGRLDEDT